MQSNGTFVQDYRAAVALTNIGVSLLERGASEMATDTFKDAIQVMKKVVRIRQNGPACEKEQIDTGTIMARVEAASKRLATCQQSSPDRTRTVCYDGVSTHWSGPSQPNTDGTLTMYPIRLDTVDSEDERDAEFECGIVLHNFACAYLCLSRASRSPRVSDKLKKGAVSLYNLSYGVIARREAIEGQLLNQPTIEARLAVAALVLRHKAQVQIEIGELEGARRSYRKILLVDSTLEKLLADEEPMVGRTTTGAPAA